jgi:hypothetical protein
MEVGNPSNFSFLQGFMATSVETSSPKVIAYYLKDSNVKSPF